MMQNVKTIFFVFFIFLFVPDLFAQVKTIKGRVTDNNGQGIPEAYVSILGTDKSTATDEKGNYSIEANEGDQIEISFTGLKAEVFKVGQKQTYNAVLVEEATEQLKEIVVTGLGIKRDKKATGYAVQTVKGDLLNAAQPSSAVASLSGKVAGLQVSDATGNLGGSKRILLRGVNSVNGNNQPLFVVDGVPMDNSSLNTKQTQRGEGGVDYGSMINDLNPEDIESVSVLKGPSAAIYGSRAANGVILITTKKGKKSEGLGVTLNSTVTFNSVSRLPGLQKKYGAGSKDDFTEVSINDKKYKIVAYNEDESWGPGYDANQLVLHWDAFDPQYPEAYLKPRPWVAPKYDVSSFFKTAISFSNTLSISNSTEKGNSRLSIGNENSTGTLPNTQIDKQFLSLQNVYKITERLSTNVGINYVRTKGIRPQIGYGNSITTRFFQYGQRQLDIKRLRPYKNNLTGQQRTWNRKAWDDPAPKYSDNPYWTAYENAPEDLRNRVYGNVSLKYDLTDDLSVKVGAAGDYYNFTINEKMAVGSQEQSFYREKHHNFHEINYDYLITYDKKFNRDFTLLASLGGNKMLRKNVHSDITTTGGLSVSNIYNLSNSRGLLEVKDAYTLKKEVSSLYANASLGVFNQIFLELSARNDWSSTLAPKKNSYFYPSASASWVFSTPLKASWLSFGKLRFGWSQVGNDTTPYEVINTYNLEPSLEGNPKASLSNTLKNNDLKAETTTNWEVGAELQFFKNRLGLNIALYKNKTVDGILPLKVSGSTGYGYKMINSAVMQNRGIEASLNLVPIKTQDWTWSVDVNFSKNINDLKSLVEGLNNYTIASAPFNARIEAVVGQAYGAIMGTDFVYDAAGKKVILKEKGTYETSENLVNLGSVLPDYNMGVRNSIKYKNIDLGFLIDIQKGGHYFSTTNMFGMNSGMLKATAQGDIREKGLVLDGVNLVKVPVLDAQNQAVKDASGNTVYQKDANGKDILKSEPNQTKVSAYNWANSFYNGPARQNVFRSDYIKLRELTLGYTFSKPLINGVFQKARVALFARNLFTWNLDNPDIDPESILGGSGNIQGIEGAFLPPVRTYGINVQLTF